jgi:hypothetical protein
VILVGAAVCVVVWIVFAVTVVERVLGRSG